MTKHDMPAGMPEAAGQHEFINLQAAFDKLEGPFIDVGGPSEPFKVLQGIDLPSPILNGNILRPLHDIADHDRQIILDARHLPVADKSVGAFLVSHLSRVDDSENDPDTLRDRMFRKDWEIAELAHKSRGYDSAMEDHYAHRARVRESLTDDYPDDPDKVENYLAEYFEDEEMPRPEDYVLNPKDYEAYPFLGFIFEAKRALKDEGLLVVSGIAVGEVHILENLGFEIVAEKDRNRFADDDEDSRKTSVADRYPFNEVVFRKRPELSSDENR